jgi:hypothetical protein
LLFSRLFSAPSNPEREPLKRGKQWDGVKQRPLIERKLLLIERKLLRLQEYWTGPPVHVYPLGAVRQASRHYSVRRAHAALNRRDAIIDLPAFLPAKLRQCTEEAD